MLSHEESLNLATPEPQPDPRPTLIRHAQDFHRRGWMLGTAGNLSARIAGDRFWITASGCAKGELSPEQFVQIARSGEVLVQPTPEANPSAEASIHQAIYRCFPEAQACYHVHSVAASLVSQGAKLNRIQLPNLEMIKGIGIWDENPQVFLDVFPNHSQVPQIAAEMTAQFQKQPPQVPACLIRDHGVTVWGRSPSEARNRVEVMEFLFDYLVQYQRLHPS